MNSVARGLGWLAARVPSSVALRIYSSRPVARTVRGLLNVLVKPGSAEVQVASGPLTGARLLINTRGEKYLWLGTYEPWVQDALSSVLRPGMTVWDVGAHIGYHSLLMHRLTNGGPLVAFEPHPDNRSRLQHHLDLNGASGVVVLPFAVGAEAGTAYLNTIEGNYATAHFSEIGEECRVVTLDSVLEKQPAPNLVKMDIEGGEEEALSGAPNLLRAVRPIWLMELHGVRGQRAVELLEGAGYTIRPIGKGVDVREDLPVGGPEHVLALP